MWSNHGNRFWNCSRSYHSDVSLNICVMICVATVYAGNTFLCKPNTNVQFLHCYLNDLFAMPFILAYSNLLIDWVGKRSASITSPIRIGCLTIFCIIIWEGIAPMLVANSTRDIFDIAAYSIGSVAYFLILFISGMLNLNPTRRNA